MPQKQWFIHLQGETFGPVSTDVVSVMLKQNRVTFTDFVWTQGLTKWMRLGDIHEFTALMPQYPKAAIPEPDEVAEIEHEPVKSKSKPPTSKQKTAAGEPPPPPKIKPIPQEAEAKPVPKPSVRRNERVPIQAKVEVAGHATFEAVNISETGVFLKSAQALPMGAEVKLKIQAKVFQKALEMTGVVIREGESDGVKGVAIDFTRVNPAYKRVLQEYVEASLSENS